MDDGNQYNKPDITVMKAGIIVAHVFINIYIWFTITSTFSENENVFNTRMPLVQVNKHLSLNKMPLSFKHLAYEINT